MRGSYNGGRRCKAWHRICSGGSGWTVCPCGSISGGVHEEEPHWTPSSIHCAGSWSDGVCVADRGEAAEPLLLLLPVLSHIILCWVPFPTALTSLDRGDTVLYRCYPKAWKNLVIEGGARQSRTPTSTWCVRKSVSSSVLPCYDGHARLCCVFTHPTSKQRS